VVASEGALIHHGVQWVAPSQSCDDRDHRR
jgi:hypothetical protein